VAKIELRPHRESVLSDFLKMPQFENE